MTPDPWEQHEEDEQDPQDEPHGSPPEMITDSEGANAALRAMERDLRPAEVSGVPSHSDPVQAHDMAQEQTAFPSGAKGDYNEWSMQSDEWRRTPNRGDW
jgi:hypothetical protein